MRFLLCLVTSLLILPPPGTAEAKADPIAPPAGVELQGSPTYPSFGLAIGNRLNWIGPYPATALPAVADSTNLLSMASPTSFRWGSLEFLTRYGLADNAALERSNFLQDLKPIPSAGFEASNRQHRPVLNPKYSRILTALVGVFGVGMFSFGAFGIFTMLNAPEQESYLVKHAQMRRARMQESRSHAIPADDRRAN